MDVEFAQPSYTVRESDGSVSVCINISGAVLERNVAVLLSTEGFEATCECLASMINNMKKLENGVEHRTISVMLSCCIILMNFLSHIYDSV